MAQISVYNSSMSGQHAAQSEAKVRTASLLSPALPQVLIGTSPFAAQKGIVEQCRGGANARVRDFRESFTPSFRLRQSTPN